MSPLRTPKFLRLLAVFAMLVFVGDLLADSLAKTCESWCAAESSETAPCPEKGPCQCICAAHVGAVIAMDFAMELRSNVPAESSLLVPDDGPPPRLAASIDHPPQLA
jgi:hypothetical protein